MKGNNFNKIIAVGDLHGDYYRLLRILKEGKFFLQDRDEWNPLADNVVLVLLGDYVDWRGEPMEGPPEEWPCNIKKLLDLIMFTYSETERLALELPNFKSKVYTLIGNHDQMMLESFRILSNLSPFMGNMILKRTGQLPFLVKLFNKLAGQVEMEELFRVINWYEQGGEMTINSYGGLKQWMEAMDGETGEFLIKHLQLGVIIDGRLFVHSIPDDPNFWIPLEEIDRLPEISRQGVFENFMWGRRLWGVSAATGAKVPPFTQEDIELFLNKMGAEMVFVGHTPFFKEKPLFAYEGKVANLDTHGVPGSNSYVEECIAGGRIESVNEDSGEKP